MIQLRQRQRRQNKYQRRLLEPANQHREQIHQEEPQLRPVDLNIQWLQQVNAIVQPLQPVQPIVQRIQYVNHI